MPAYQAERASAPSDVPPVIQVATATDGGYLPYLAVLCATLGRSRAAGVEVVLSVLYRDVDPADRERVGSVAAGIDVRWYEVGDALAGSRGAHLAAFAGRPQYFRCLLADLLPADVTRVIYLDADTLVRSDLTALWRTDLAGAPVGAVVDSLGTVRGAIDRWRELGLDGDSPYFNSGVLLIDLAAWRARDAGWAAVRRSAADRDHLLAAGRWPQHDQYGLNVVFHRRWRHLAPTWNWFTYQPYRPAAVLHVLSSSGRPGARYCHPRYTRAFLDAVDRTPWRGWRPGTAPR